MQRSHLHSRISLDYSCGNSIGGGVSEIVTSPWVLGNGAFYHGMDWASDDPVIPYSSKRLTAPYADTQPSRAFPSAVVGCGLGWVQEASGHMTDLGPRERPNRSLLVYSSSPCEEHPVSCDRRSRIGRSKTDSLHLHVQLASAEGLFPDRLASRRPRGQVCTYQFWVEYVSLRRVSLSALRAIGRKSM